MRLFEKGIFTARAGNTVERAIDANGELSFVAETAWTAARRFLSEAAARGEDVPVFVGEASSSVTTLVAWGLLEKLRLNGRRSSVTLRDLRPLHGRQAGDLRKLDGQVIDPSYRRAYARVLTPTWIADEVSQSDGVDPEPIRELMSRLVPDSRVRRAILERLGLSIEECARTSATGWGVTVYSNGIRLNAGQVEIFNLDPGLADFGLLGPPLREVPGCTSHQTSYATLGKEGFKIRGPVGAVVHAYDDFREQHFNAIRKARRNGYRWKSSHSRSVLAYMEQELSRALPDPEWSVRPRSEAPTADDSELAEIPSVEGKRRMRMHYARERSPAKVAEAKEAWRARDPLLRCFLCNFSFEERYGVSYVEAHHRIPLSKLGARAVVETRVEDLAPLCANCHRFVHKPGNDMTLEELKTKLGG